MAKEMGGILDTNESDWEEINPEELQGEQLGKEQEETETKRQSLTPKVVGLMEKISEYGYLTMHEVQFIFGNKTWAYKVINGLRSEGLIADHDTLMSPRTAHYLTSKGYRVLGKLGRLKVGGRFKPERYTTFIFRHRMACAKVGLLLERHPLVHEFLPESRLFRRRKSELDKLCDGEFWYKVASPGDADRVGLEVELTLKSNGKLDESFRQLARRGDLGQVWWICGEENIRRALRREAQRHYLGDQRHFFALLAEFLSAKGKGELMEPTGTLLSIDPEKPTLLPRPPEPPPPPEPMPGPEPVQAAQAEAPRQPQPEPWPQAHPQSWAEREQRSLRERIESLWWELRWKQQERIRQALEIAGVLLAMGAAMAFAWRQMPALGPPPPAAAARWRSRKPDAIYWSRGEFSLAVPFLESKGSQYRMKISMDRTEPEFWGGCDVRTLAVADAQGRELGRWPLRDGSLYGRQGWTVGPLNFRAAPAARKLIVTAVMGGSSVYGSCSDWSVPVGFR